MERVVECVWLGQAGSWVGDQVGGWMESWVRGRTGWLGGWQGDGWKSDKAAGKDGWEGA